LAVWYIRIKEKKNSQKSPYQICGKQSINGTGFFLQTLVFPCQYHSNTSPHSFIYHRYQLYNLNKVQSSHFVISIKWSITENTRNCTNTQFYLTMQHVSAVQPTAGTLSQNYTTESETVPRGLSFTSTIRQIYNCLNVASIFVFHEME